MDWFIISFLLIIAWGISVIILFLEINHLRTVNKIQEEIIKIDSAIIAKLEKVK